MRDVSAAMQTALADEHATLIPLLTIHTDPAIRRARFPRDVTFAGETYIADTFEFDLLRQDLKGERPRLVLSIQNIEDPETEAELPWSTYLKTHDLNGVKVSLRAVLESLLDDEDAVLTNLWWYISGYPVDGQWGRFGLSPVEDPIVGQAPWLSIGATRCTWALLGLYKQGPCTSESDLGYCPGTLEDCIARFPEGATLPFGPNYPLMGRGARSRRGG